MRMHLGRPCLLGHHHDHPYYLLDFPGGCHRVSTLAAATLSAGKESVLAPRRFRSLGVGKSIPKDFLEPISGEVAMFEQSTAFCVVLVREVADDLSAEHNLGLVDIEDIEARKYVCGIINATDSYQQVFPPLHAEVLKFRDLQIFLSSPSWLKTIPEDFPAATQ